MEDKSAVAAAVETVTQPQAEATVPSSRTLDPKLEQYARQERALQQQRRDLDEDRKKWAAAQDEQRAKYISKDRLTSDPLSVLEEAGYNHAQIAEMLGNASNQDPALRALRAELRAIKDQQEQSSKNNEEVVKQQYNQAVAQMRRDIESIVGANPDTFESISREGMHDAVVALVEETFNKEGYVMDLTEAANQVEQYLVDHAIKMVQGNKKMQSRLQTQPSKAADTGSAQPKTITHGMQQASPSPKLSDKERRERAIAAFQGKLT